MNIYGGQDRTAENVQPDTETTLSSVLRHFEIFSFYLAGGLSSVYFALNDLKREVKVVDSSTLNLKSYSTSLFTLAGQKRQGKRLARNFKSDLSPDLQ